MRTTKFALLMLIGATAVAPAAATVMINSPAQQPSACFDSVGGCDPAALPKANAPAEPEMPAPLVAVAVGVLALALAFGRRNGLQEVVS
ncbi:MAG: hypothetical protein KGQ52_12080 [Alphaproteobacteria bacterium]|nr:hypothetical protein [Alphaproteobacteria bacterium]